MDILSRRIPSTGRLTPHQLHLSRETLIPEVPLRSRRRGTQDVQSLSIACRPYPRGSVGTLASRRSPWTEQEQFEHPPAPPPLTRSLMDLGGCQLGVGMNIDHNSVRSGSRTQLQPPRFSTTRDTLMRTRTGLSDQCIDSSDDISHSSHIYQNQPLLVKNMDQYNSYADELNRCDSTVEEPTTRRNRPSSKSRGVRSVKATPTTSGRNTFTKSTQRKGNYPAGDRGLNRGSLSPPSEEYDDYDDFD